LTKHYVTVTLKQLVNVLIKSALFNLFTVTLSSINYYKYYMTLHAQCPMQVIVVVYHVTATPKQQHIF